MGEQGSFDTNRIWSMETAMRAEEFWQSFSPADDARPGVFDGFYPEKTYGLLDIGDYLSLVLLDTDHIEAIAGVQTDWLTRVLADRQERPHLIVANHVPAYPSYEPMPRGGSKIDDCSIKKIVAWVNQGCKQ